MRCIINTEFKIKIKALIIKDEQPLNKPSGCAYMSTL